MKRTTIKSAFEIALEAWQATRSARFAAIVDAISAKEPARELVGASGKKVDLAKWLDLADAGDWRDMPRLIATLTTCNSPQALERVNKLAARDDPRLVPGLLQVAEDAPYTAGTSRKFWQGVLAALEASRDPRARDGMVSLSKRYKTINDTNMGAWIGSAMAKSAAKIPEPKPLDAKLEKLLGELELEVLGEAGATKPKEKQKPTSSPEAMFAAIVEGPDDDDARLVYADLLSEQGDSDRAEFIVLQVERAAGRGTPERADLERTKYTHDLATRYRPPLSAGADRVIFERGFPQEVQLATKGLAHIADAIEWGTVRVLERVAYAPAMAVQKLLDSGRAKNLQRVEAIPPRWLDKLRTPTFPWTHVSLINEDLEPAHFARFPRLTHLEIVRENLDARLFAAVPEVQSIQLDDVTLSDGAELFADTPKLRRLVLGHRATPERFGGLKLEELDIRGNAAVADQFLRGIPTVKTLHFSGRETDLGAIASLFDRYPALERATFHLSGSSVARIERKDKLLLLVAPAGSRMNHYYDQLVEAATKLGGRVENLELYPEMPRHVRPPMSEEVIAKVRAAWPKLALRELL